MLTSSDAHHEQANYFLFRLVECKEAHAVALATLIEHRIPRDRGATIVQKVVAQPQACERCGAPIGAARVAVRDLVVDACANVGQRKIGIEQHRSANALQRGRTARRTSEGVEQPAAVRRGTRRGARTEVTAGVPPSSRYVAHLARKPRRPRTQREHACTEWPHANADKQRGPETWSGQERTSIHVSESNHPEGSKRGLTDARCQVAASEAQVGRLEAADRERRILAEGGYPRTELTGALNSKRSRTLGPMGGSTNHPHPRT